MDRWSKIIKNSKIKNTPSILETFKSIKKSQNFPKSQNFGGRSVRGLGVNHFLKNLYLRVTDGMKSENLHDFLWDDHGLLFLTTRKKNKIKKNFQNFCHAILYWKQSEKTLKKQKFPKFDKIKGKINGQKRWKLFKKRLGNHQKCSVALKTELKVLKHIHKDEVWRLSSDLKASNNFSSPKFIGGWTTTPPVRSQFSVLISKF